ncbi:hypothetical protein SE92_03455 [Bradyrhizobium sp. AT1]|uniref:hypothetical protein n=1 Tax=Bradyrhizobium sp. AT1 TaxID=574934 RepID=UPI0007974248|nr:hypothetical protein [Bradyrhizobium sp. AT1]KYG19431.1 hypothetical protein SE92_03455 [Bradyrhizobium sp. AT1]
MGYFEGLASSSFKTTEDGRRLFFPWGALGRGYAIGSEERYGRLRKQVKAYMVVSLLPVILAPIIFHGYTISFASAAISLAFYLAWMWVLLPRLEAADEGLSLKESMTSQARAHGPVVLWPLTIGSLVFVAGGLLMSVGETGSRMIGLAVTLFFGLCAAMNIWLLMLRRKAT